jgi:NAD(P)H-hydrate epimerase
VTKIVSVGQMRQLEEAANASGWTYDDMMSMAGAAVAGEVLRRVPNPAGRRAVVLAGSGNNGGDGLVAARHLAEAGMQTAVYLAGKRPSHETNMAALEQRGVLIVQGDEDQRHRVLSNLVTACDALIDSVLGTGFRLPLRPEVASLLAVVRSVLDERKSAPLIVAVDAPSGVDCDTGESSPETLAADVTVTLGAAKVGLLRSPGVGLAGRLVIADIGIGAQLGLLTGGTVEFITADEVRRWLPARPLDAHKGTFGTALLVVGSVNYPGSAVLAGRGAYRVGTGLVTLAVPAAIQASLVGSLPEATWVVLPEEVGVIAKGAAEVLRAEMGRATALLIGPGIGRETPTATFLERFLAGTETSSRPAIGFVHERESPLLNPSLLAPVVVDADGLRLMAALAEWPKRLPPESILTPHPGEMTALTGESIDAIQTDRIAAARGWSAQWGHVVVLKGAHTVIAHPGGQTAVLPFATPALARAGTGDVLAGAIVGLRAQGVKPFEAAVLGGYLHGRAGEIAAERLNGSDGVLASDVAEALPAAIAEIRRAV